MCRVLVVDDEEDVRLAVTRRLERDGLKVDTAASATEGIEKLRTANHAYDIVLADMVMEDPDSGLRILQAALGADIFTEVIILTAYGNVTNAVECMKRGAFDYVEKNIPDVDVYDLISLKVGLAMERRRSALNTVRRVNQFGIRNRTGKT